MSPWYATTLDPYQIEEPIGEGGMSTVFRAHPSEPVHRDVAIDLLQPEVSMPDVAAAVRHARGPGDRPDAGGRRRRSERHAPRPRGPREQAAGGRQAPDNPTRLLADALLRLGRTEESAELITGFESAVTLSASDPQRGPAPIIHRSTRRSSRSAAPFRMEGTERVVPATLELALTR